MGGLGPEGGWGDGPKRPNQWTALQLGIGRRSRSDVDVWVGPRMF